MEILQHIRYHKIPFVLNEQPKTKKTSKWCVTEKVHGANFSIYLYPSGKVKCAKRTGFISDTENFFDHFEILDKYRSNFNALANHFFASSPVTCVVLFGELFGRGFPGYEGLRPVQRGVWYSPM